MANDHIKTDIPAYLHGDLPESRQRQIESHVAGCDSCRVALNKARAKLARSKRQALKNASPDPLPNLLIARLGRQTGLPRPSDGRPGKWLLLLALVVGIVYFVKHKGISPTVPPIVSPKPEVAISTSIPSGTQAAPPFDVAKSSPAAVAAPITVPVVKVSPAPPMPPVEKAKPAAPEPPQTWNGTDSGVKDFRELVINGRRTWHALWSEMGHDDPAPPINFLNNMLVGVFAGEQAAGSQVLLGQPKNVDEEVQIPYRITAVVVSSGTVTAVTHPYALTTIPRVPKAVHLVRQQS